MAWVSSCGSRLDLESRMSKIDAQVKKNGKKIQNEPQVPEFDLSRSSDVVNYYNPTGRRDPFKAFDGKPKVEQEQVFGSALEQFELGDLELTAIVWGIAKPKALFRAPDGFNYTGEKGVRIGRNGGKISKVSRSKVMVNEQFRGPLGEIAVRDLEMKLHEDEEKKEMKPAENLQFSFSGSK